MKFATDWAHVPAFRSASPPVKRVALKLTGYDNALSAEDAVDTAHDVINSSEILRHGIEHGYGISDTAINAAIRDWQQTQKD